MLLAGLACLAACLTPPAWVLPGQRVRPGCRAKRQTSQEKQMHVRKASERRLQGQRRGRREWDTAPGRVLYVYSVGRAVGSSGNSDSDSDSDSDREAALSADPALW
ncbi:hypothetical protein BKA80DRAFT_111011 [Phyllosticta citrichinensis]